MFDTRARLFCCACLKDAAGAGESVPLRLFKIRISTQLTYCSVTLNGHCHEIFNPFFMILTHTLKYSIFAYGFDFSEILACA